ncbi:ABC transporter permease [Paraclostridium ghonii]|uniref:ABC-2 type transport system permease protein n=1 Tax=Paraclostridium ghonii TaxID=29358 RepID=A0ABU0MZ86_9FIRM|nr:ABC transporter permease [Paeniclostridium ghonii]MDQ0556181.1 ABC-2 type transport system permease protein [Paeniclostridium ghonii]
MRIKAIIIRIIKQTIHDKRTLALMMIAPMIVMALVYFLFNSNEDKLLNIGVYNTSDEFNENLEKSDLNVKKYSNKNEIEDKIINDNLDAFIVEGNNKLEVTYENSSPINTKEIQAKLQSTLLKDEFLKISSMANNKIDKSKIQQNYVYSNEELTYFDTISSILIGFFVFFFVFLVSGISLLKERTTGTLDRLLSTPIKRSEIVIGYLIGYGIFAIMQTILIVLFSIYILNINIEGSIPLVVIVNILIALVALSLGLLLSTFANSEFQIMQFIPIIIVPQIFFTGLIPIENMDGWLQNISKIIPLYYGTNALNGIFVKGFNFNNIYNDCIILIIFILVLYALNIFGLKRYRKI